MMRFKEGFLWKDKKLRLTYIIAGVALAGLVYSLIYVLMDSERLESFYDPIADPIVAIGTGIIALMFWFYQGNRSWKESLPKKLTVHFMFDGKCVMSCYEAYLSGPSDIRAWSQQIGSQMAGVQYISFFPYIKSSKPKVTKSSIELVDNKKVDIMLYEAVFFLRDDNFIGPDRVVKKPELVNKYLIWLYNNPDTPKNIEHFENERPETPFTVEEAIQEYNKKQSKDME